MGGRHGFWLDSRGEVRLAAGPGEVAVLVQLIDQLDELLAPDGADTHEVADPLAALVGIGTSTEAPDDPALARLLPDAYLDDPERAAEFRRYTELTLRTAKRANAARVREFMATDPDAPLDPGDRDAWLLVLNDLRLALGTRLEVTEDVEAEEAARATWAADDPRHLMHDVYDWLGYLQATLLQAYAP